VSTLEKTKHINLKRRLKVRFQFDNDYVDLTYNDNIGGRPLDEEFFKITGGRLLLGDPNDVEIITELIHALEHGSDNAHLYYRVGSGHWGMVTGAEFEEMAVEEKEVMPGTHARWNCDRVQFSYEKEDGTLREGKVEKYRIFANGRGLNSISDTEEAARERCERLNQQFLDTEFTRCLLRDSDVEY
jgi:hypothetical protein